ncbi:hypothetical protein FVE85_3085 [Porphyridium purpureum]|uniref:Uncharacterized protein n=1 Tax=Porphyridium purpureum TaxID=35688 RepID=A0A5J4YVW1_PORPP|nr:hypothetical protein FVE85_3085 [Porphyridium purpureum]|eukprot:POR0612..scf227_4
MRGGGYMPERMSKSASKSASKSGNEEGATAALESRETSFGIQTDWNALDAFVRRQLEAVRTLENHLTGDPKLWLIPCVALTDYVKTAEATWEKALHHRLLSAPPDQAESADEDKLFHRIFELLKKTSAELQKSVDDMAQHDQQRTIVLEILSDYRALLRSFRKENARHSEYVEAFDHYVQKLDKMSSRFGGKARVDRNVAKRDDAKKSADKSVDKLREIMTKIDDDLQEIVWVSCMENVRMLQTTSTTFTNCLDVLRPLLEDHVDLVLHDETSRLVQGWAATPSIEELTSEASLAEAATSGWAEKTARATDEALRAKREQEQLREAHFQRATTEFQHVKKESAFLKSATAETQSVELAEKVHEEKQKTASDKQFEAVLEQAEKELGEKEMPERHPSPVTATPEKAHPERAEAVPEPELWDRTPEETKQPAQVEAMM